MDDHWLRFASWAWPVIVAAAVGSIQRYGISRERSWAFRLGLVVDHRSEVVDTEVPAHLHPRLGTAVAVAKMSERSFGFALAEPRIGIVAYSSDDSAGGTGMFAHGRLVAVIDGGRTHLHYKGCISPFGAATLAASFAVPLLGWDMPWTDGVKMGALLGVFVAGVCLWELWSLRRIHRALVTALTGVR